MAGLTIKRDADSQSGACRLSGFACTLSLEFQLPLSFEIQHGGDYQSNNRPGHSSGKHEEYTQHRMSISGVAGSSRPGLTDSDHGNGYKYADDRTSAHPQRNYHVSPGWSL